MSDQLVKDTVIARSEAPNVYFLVEGVETSKYYNRRIYRNEEALCYKVYRCTSTGKLIHKKSQYNHSHLKIEGETLISLGLGKNAGQIVKGYPVEAIFNRRIKFAQKKIAEWQKEIDRANDSLREVAYNKFDPVI